MQIFSQHFSNKIEMKIPEKQIVFQTVCLKSVDFRDAMQKLDNSFHIRSSW